MTTRSEELGRLLQGARQRSKLSVRAAAQVAGFSEGLWRQLEKGYRQVTAEVTVPTNPRPSTVRAAAAAVGLDVQEALTAAGYLDEAAQERSVARGGDDATFVATGSGGPRNLSDLTLEQLADEARRLNDEMVRRLRADGP